MNIQFDVKDSKEVKGKYQLNIYIGGLCVSTIAIYNSDIEAMQHQGIINYRNKDKTVDSAGVLLTSKVFKTK